MIMIRGYINSNSIKYTEEMADTVATIIQADLSAMVGYMIILTVPISFFVISKKNRRIIMNDLKRIWKIIRCDTNNAVVPVSRST